MLWVLLFFREEVCRSPVPQYHGPSEPSWCADGRAVSRKIQMTHKCREDLKHSVSVSHLCTSDQADLLYHSQFIRCVQTRTRTRSLTGDSEYLEDISQHTVRFKVSTQDWSLLCGLHTALSDTYSSDPGPGPGTWFRETGCQLRWIVGVLCRSLGEYTWRKKYFIYSLNHSFWHHSHHSSCFCSRSVCLSRSTFSLTCSSANRPAGVSVSAPCSQCCCSGLGQYTDVTHVDHQRNLTGLLLIFISIFIFIWTANVF